MNTPDPLSTNAETGLGSHATPGAIPGAGQPGMGGSGAGEPRDVATWEATVMKDVATLLDSLEVARAEWEALNERLGQARERLKAAEGRAANAEQVASEIAGLRKEAESLRADKAALQQAVTDQTAEADTQKVARHAAERERDEARSRLENEQATRQRAGEVATGELELVRRQLSEAEEELERKAEQWAHAERAREKSNALTQKISGELDQLRAELDKVRRERDLLAESGKDIASAKERIEQTDRERAEAEEFVQKQQAEIQRLTEESEQNLVQLCDMRSRINRLETERDDASSNAKRKTKKILRKIHEVLDSVGAPAGEDMSYGERIRRLVDKLTGAAPLDLDEPFDSFDSSVAHPVHETANPGRPRSPMAASFVVAGSHGASFLLSPCPRRSGLAQEATFDSERRPYRGAVHRVRGLRPVSFAVP